MQNETSTKLQEDLVKIATKVGIDIVQQIAKESLLQNPKLKLKDFIKVLDEVLEKNII